MLDRGRLEKDNRAARAFINEWRLVGGELEKAYRAARAFVDGRGHGSGGLS